MEGKRAHFLGMGLRNRGCTLVETFLSGHHQVAPLAQKRLEKELLDAVNRVEHEPIEAADKGTCFNVVIDCLISHRKCEYEGMDIQSGELA